MNTFRTTVNFDQTLHRQLSMEAAARGVSLSELINQVLSNKNVLCKDAAMKSYEDDVKFFRAMAKKLGNVDLGKVLRDQRNRVRD